MFSNRLNRKLALIAAVLSLSVGLLAQASRKGILEGMVYDKSNRSPLIGVNIVVMGTYLGTSSDINGHYIIPNVNPGEYTLEITYIGYKVVQKTGVRVETGQTLQLNFELEQTALALGQEVVIIGEKPLMQINETGTVRTIGREELANKPIENVEDIVAQQVGVSHQDNEIHIRGSRTYEVQYLLDNVSVQDPLSGTGFGLNVSANAIEEVEVITGGFKAEYGQATSGVVSVKTKSGGDNLEGFFSYKSDHWGLFRDEAWSFNTDIIEMNLGGREPLTSGLLPALKIKLPGQIYFFFNAYASIADDYSGKTATQLYSSISPRMPISGSDLFTGTSFSPRQNNNWNLLSKWTWKLNDTQKLIYTYNRSLTINQNTQSLQTNLEYVEPGPGFPYEYSKNLDLFNVYTHDNEQSSLTWSHTINKRTFYELRLSRFFAHLRADWMGSKWADYTMAIDVPRIPVEYYSPVNDSTKVRIIPGDGFYDYGNADVWHDHYAEFYTLKGELTSHIGDIHTLKTGGEASFNEMQLIDVIDPYTEGGYGSSQDIYRVYPADGAIYIQDDIRFEGFFLNAGLRLDYWFPGKYVDDAIENEDNILTDEMRNQYKEDTYNFFGRRFKMRLMPRLGVSFPISDNQMLFLNYGHFSKRPKPQFIYAKLGNISSKSSYQKFGNPNLNPETSVIYELGLRHQFSKNDVISVTAFYKDIFDYVQTTTISGIPRIGSAIFYINLDYARSRGIEMEYKTRLAKNFSGSVNGSYSVATTKSSSPDVGLLIAQGSINEQPIKETYAVWDRPWQISINGNYYIPPGSGPRVLGVNIFGNWNINLRWFAQAGKRYTPVSFVYYRSSDNRPIYTEVEDQTLRYSKIGSMWKWADLSIKKYFSSRSEHFKYVFSIEVKNLFNDKNANIINPVTGEAYEYGDLIPSSWNDPLYPDLTYPVSNPYPLNPARYREPRHIRMGLSVEF